MAAAIAGAARGAGPLRGAAPYRGVSVRLAGAADVAVVGSFPSGDWLLSWVPLALGLACMRIAVAGWEGPAGVT